MFDETDSVEQNQVSRIAFTNASKRHRLGKAHIRHVLATCTPEAIVTTRGEHGWRYVGPDDRGLELEVIAVELEGGTLLVIHAMPTALWGRHRDG